MLDENENVKMSKAERTGEVGRRPRQRQNRAQITRTHRGELTISEPQELNEVLRGRKILSVEPGATPGLMIVNLELNAEEREAHPELRLFLTVFIGSRKGSSEANYHSTSTLDFKGADGRSTADMM